MAINYRFLGYPQAFPPPFEELTALQQRQIDAVMNVLETAPGDFRAAGSADPGIIDDYPNENNQQGWNQDFRWIRQEFQPSAGGAVYGGLDYMVALMIAACKEPALYRQTLIDAIAQGKAPTSGEDDDIDYFLLPLPSPLPAALSVPVFRETLTGVTGPSSLLIGVAFTKMGTGSSVTLSIPGQSPDPVFSDNEPSRLISVPFDAQPIVVESATGTPECSIVVGFA